MKLILGKKQKGDIDKISNQTKKVLHGIPIKKRNELKEFYDKLCDYVHLSEEAQTDATRDPGLNRALGLRFYEEDVKMLKKTLEYCHYLLLHSLEKPTSAF